MSVPQVAIVGKANVGKSSLFNLLIEKKKSIVISIPHTTRDRIIDYGEINDKRFMFIDTGGFSKQTELSTYVLKQLSMSLIRANIIIVLFDATQPPTQEDEELVEMVRKYNKAFLLVANKIDIKKSQENINEYYKFGEIIPISVTHKKNIDLLEEKLLSFAKEGERKEKTCSAKIAVIGKPNVGKSSIINAILNEERVNVSPFPGTTTDSIDTEFTYEGKSYLLIDTAGLKRKTKLKKEIEKITTLRTIFSINRADIVILVIDAKENITDEDKKIASYAQKVNKCLIIVLNKWDTVAKKEETLQKAKTKLFFINYAPIVSTCAVERKNINKLLRWIKVVEEEYRKRIATAKLNQDMQKVIKRYQPFSKRGKEIKIKYATQVSISPPTFVLFTTKPKEITKNYKKYILNNLYKLYKFTGCSIRIRFKTPQQS
ncbi:MAG: ribosome biogenesis GTPase Der [Deltaproteobacteria bacterium]|nr:ribosome biogenesis GTPase Der [Deltaproteobacteria bacterium]